MYLEHFGLHEAPFRITPHTDFFFDGAERGATLEALAYAVLHEEGIVKVSGEVGSGKTMLCRVLIERLPPHARTVYLADPSLSREEILQTIVEELELERPDSRFTVALRKLQEQLIRLYAAGVRVVLLIDEAHAMPAEALEQVRLLSNLESSRHKLLQIVLFAQPELDRALSAPSMRQLKDRITHSFRMRPLNTQEVGKYLTFRMRAAGYRGPDVFERRAVGLIARASGGLTRRVNVLADKSLLAAFSEDGHAVSPREVRKAIADSEFAPISRPRRVAAAITATLIAGAVLGAGAHWTLSGRMSTRSATAQPLEGVAPLSADKASGLRRVLPMHSDAAHPAASVAAPPAQPASAVASPAASSGPSAGHVGAPGTNAASGPAQLAAAAPVAAPGSSASNAPALESNAASGPAPRTAPAQLAAAAPVVAPGSSASNAAVLGSNAASGPVPQAAPAQPPAVAPDAPSASSASNAGVLGTNAASIPAPKAASALLAATQVARMAHYAPGSHPLLRERIAAARALLASEPNASYSLELFSTSNADPARMERFLLRARALVPLTELYVVPVGSRGSYRLQVLYGVYRDRAAAEQEAKHLPPKYLKAFHARPRNLAELRREV